LRGHLRLHGINPDDLQAADSRAVFDPFGVDVWDEIDVIQDERQRRLADWFTEGKTDREIALETGRSEAMVNHWRQGLFGHQSAANPSATRSTDPDRPRHPRPGWSKCWVVKTKD
jgi:hypothetical protein